jgi:hypothetical protein
MAIKKDDAEDNLNYKEKKDKTQRVKLAKVEAPKVIDIGKMLLLKRLTEQGDFKKIKELKGPMFDYLKPSYKKGLKKK